MSLTMENVHLENASPLKKILSLTPEWLNSEEMLLSSMTFLVQQTAQNKMLVFSSPSKFQMKRVHAWVQLILEMVIHSIIQSKQMVMEKEDMRVMKIMIEKSN